MSSVGMGEVTVTRARETVLEIQAMEREEDGEARTGHGSRNRKDSGGKHS